MAKYAVGYVLALLLVAMVGLVAWDGGSGFRLPWTNVGGGFGGIRGEVRVVPPDRFPIGGPGAFPGEIHFAEPPPDLIVTDINGSTSLGATSYCWSDIRSSVCSESVGGPAPAFVSTADHLVTLDFQMVWDVVLEIEPEDPFCPAFSVELPGTWDMRLDMLGRPGEFLVHLFATTSRGDASWVLRVDNQVDVPSGDDSGC